MGPNRARADQASAALVAPRGGFHWRTFASDAALVTGGALAANILNFVYHSALSRALGPDAYGSLATLLGISMVAGVVGSAIGTVAMQETARFWALRNDASIGAFGRARLGSAVGLAAAVSIAIAILAIPLSRYLHIADAAAWIALAASLFAGVVAAFARGAIQGAHRFGWYATSLVAESALKLAAGFALARAGFGLGGAMSGIAIGLFVGAIIALASLLGGQTPDAPAPPASSYRSATIRLAVIFGASTALLYVDLVFAKHALSGADAGFYGAAGVLARIIPFGVGLIVPLVTPKAVAASHTSRDELVRLLSVTFGAAVAGAAAVLALMEIRPGALIAVMFGNGFAAAAPLLRVYAVDGMLLALGMLGTGYLAAMGEYGIVPWIAGAAIVEGCAMALWGDTPMHLLGIAIAGNVALLVPIVALVVRSVRVAPQAANPLVDEASRSLASPRSS